MESSKKELLENAENIAVIGCSAKPYRTSHHIAEYLQDHGYRIIPVNPNYDRILGEQVYASLAEVPEDIDIHIADIFRNKMHTAEMVEQVIMRAGATGVPTAVWTQLDVSSRAARVRAEEAGLRYIENECLMVEHQRLLGP